MANDYAGCKRYAVTSAVNTINTVTTDILKPAKLRLVTVTYSGSVTTNVTVTLVSGAGAAFNCVLNTIAISAGTTGVYIPATPVPFNADDTIQVSAPAVAAVTSSVTIYVDRAVVD